MPRDSTENPSATKSAWSELARRLKARPDTEHEQALLRIVILAGVLTYLLVSRFEHPELVSLRQLAVVFSSLFVFSIGLFAAILISPGKSVLRRLVAMVVDIGISTYWLVVTGPVGAPWYAIYLWLTFGYGFRYGQRYLYLSGVLSLAGFSLVIATTEFWRQHLGLSFGLLAALVILPGYVAILLQRLNAATRRAEEANRAKSDFLARMSHEIRTPLNGIIGLSELLKSCKLGAEEREYADAVHTSGHALLNLIEDVLDISKIEAGKVSIEHAEFDLHALIGGTVRMFTPQAEAKSLRLASHIALNTPYRLLGDSLHLRQVLINLLGNAIKFTERGSVEVRCHPVRLQSARSLIRFQIIDTGIGIPAEVQPRIFEKFSQADESTTRRFGGTGLGTSIAKHLVELMGGRIGFDSTPGIGTNFWFDVELEQAGEPLPEPEVESLRGCRVLRLCLPSRAEQTEVARCLRGWGLDFQTVTSVRDAVARLVGGATQHTPFEILVLDELAPTPDIERFVESLDTDLALYGLTVLMRSAGPAEVPADSALGRRTHLLPSPMDKALLFNALHASYVGTHDDTVISFAEHVGRRRPGGREVRVLVAEDNATNRMVIGRILERAGFGHRLVDDGHQVLEALEEEPFDVAIVDMQMPGLSGVEAYKLYRFAHADEPRPVPFIVLTANATVEARRAAREAGIEHYLTKPVASAQLLRAIAEVTGTHPGPRPEAAADRPVRNPAEIGDELDPSQLNDLLALAPSHDFGERLIQGFRSDAATLLEQMDGTLQTCETESFRDLAHAFKGSAANLGLVALSRQAAAMEKLTDLELSSSGRRQLGTLEEGLERALQALATELQRRRTAT